MKLLATIIATALLAVPAAASGAATHHRHKPKPPTVKTVLRDCTRDGKLNKRYTLTLLKRTKRHIPADVAQYSDCKRVIAKAIKKAERKHHRTHHRGRRS
jgi:hypothetical protein